MNYSRFSKRHEIKFLIDYHEYQRIAAILDNFMEKDLHGNNGMYHIRSLYFDDVFDTGFYEKSSGIDNRRKYRVRIYNMTDAIIKLERKSKFGKMTNKDSIKLSKKEYFKLIDGDIEFLKNKSSPGKDFYVESKGKKIVPRVIIDYTREVFMLPYQNIRVTFDFEVMAGKGDNVFDKNVFMNKITGKNVILEVKYDNFFPTHIFQLIFSKNKTRISISKYALSRVYMAKMGLI